MTDGSELMTVSSRYLEGLHDDLARLHGENHKLLEKVTRLSTENADLANRLEDVEALLEKLSDMLPINPEEIVGEQS